MSQVQRAGYCPSPSTEVVVCPRCRGRGRVVYALQHREEEDCVMCDGLRICYKQVRYSPIPQEDINDPFRIEPRGL